MDPRRWEHRDQEDIERAKEMQASGATGRGLPISKKYRVDPLYSREPKALCGNVTKLGLPPCQYGEGRYCYSRKVCGSQVDLNDPDNYTEAARRKARMEEEAAIEHARMISSKVQGEEVMSDEEYNELVRRILED